MEHDLSLIHIYSDRNLQVMNFFRTLKDEGCLPDGIENYSGDEDVYKRQV